MNERQRLEAERLDWLKRTDRHYADVEVNRRERKPRPTRQKAEDPK